MNCKNNNSIGENLFELRKVYEKGGIDIANIEVNPFLQFAKWFNEAKGIKDLEPNAMSLATADKDGKPSARIVLLKSYDEKGFTFFSNYSSRKGEELKENKFASILFFWAQLERQIRIEGEIELLSKKESYEYFSSRPRESRIGAHASEQSRVIDSQEELFKKFSHFESLFENQEIPLPDNWGGYILVPNKFEFWQGRPSRLHDRMEYSLHDKTWVIKRLQP